MQTLLLGVIFYKKVIYMPENDNSTATATQQTEVKQAVKSGGIQRVEMVSAKENPIENNVVPEATTTNNEGANATSDATNGGTADDKTKAIPPAPTITDEQLTAFFKEKGIDYEGIDKLKEKLTAPAQTSTELTEEQKKQKELAREKRLLDKFIAGGGTAESYVAIKGVATADPNQFAINQAKADLIKIGYTLEEADVYVKENLGQIDDAELEQNEDETDKQYKKRVKEFNAQLLAANSNPNIDKAKWVLQNLNEAIEAEDLQAQNELTISANIDEQFKKLSLKDTYEIGTINGTAIPPIESEVPEAEIVAIQTMFKDPNQRQQLLYNQDGNLNYTQIANVYVENAKLKAAMKTSYHEGSTRTIEAFQKTFPARSAQELGVGGSPVRPNGQKGKVVKAGTPTRV